jgi:hypothetical protein
VRCDPAALRPAALAQRRAIFGDVHLHNAVNLLQPHLNLTYRWIIADHRWKLILPHPPNLGRDNQPKAGGLPELYDLISDPHENRNLAPARPELVSRLTSQIEDWWPLSQ